MRQLIILIVTIVTVSTQLPEPRSSKYCCTPSQWEGTQAGIGGYDGRGKAAGLSTSGMVAFDADIQKVFSYTNTTTAQRTFVTKTIQDFEKGYQFTIDVLNQRCVKTKLRQKFNKGCVPDDAKPMGDFYYGAASEKLNIKSFSLRSEAPGTLLDVFLTVTQELCIPVAEAIIGSTNNVPMVVTIGFVNIQPGIKDPSVFNPPAICGQNTTVDIPPSHIEPQFRIFQV